MNNKLNKNVVFISSLIMAIIAELFLVYIIYFNPNKIAPIYNTELQVWVNALMNSLSAICLAVAVLFIKQKKKTQHILYIHFSILYSSIILLNYIYYHLSVGHVRFTNPDFRNVYLVILATHLLSSVISLPLIFSTYTLGIFNYLDEHKKLAKATFYLWEYVSITGVVIVLMLKFLNT
jgi:putative membrane protein